jgi:hypothetical protein
MFKPSLTSVRQNEIVSRLCVKSYMLPSSPPAGTTAAPGASSCVPSCPSWSAVGA